MKRQRGSNRAWFGLLLLSFVAIVYVFMLGRLEPLLGQHDDLGQRERLGQFLNSSILDAATFAGNETTKKQKEYALMISELQADVYGLPFEEFYSVESDGTNLWDSDPNLPQWIKRYLNWHKQRRQQLNMNNWKSERWLVMQCLDGQDRRCGGTSDRLKPLPLLLRIAYESKRLLLIHWTRPGMLEEYLVPPRGGVDWRIPPQMAEVVSSPPVRSNKIVLDTEDVSLASFETSGKLANSSNGKRLNPGRALRRYAAGNMSLIRSRHQSYDSGAGLYNGRRDEGEPLFSAVFHNIWRVFFRPSRHVATIVESLLADMSLVPGAYVSSHLRALYARPDRHPEQSRDWARNAVNCAAQLRPGAPIFFVSDCDNATEYAPRYGKMRKTRVVTHIPNPNPPLHLDERTDRPVEDFYDTFVDLYLIALGGCVTFSEGGFGHWGLLIGGNISCHYRINVDKQRQQIRNRCDWDGTAIEPTITQSRSDQGPIFPDPMEG